MTKRTFNSNLTLLMRAARFGTDKHIKNCVKTLVDEHARLTANVKALQDLNGFNRVFGNDVQLRKFTKEFKRQMAAGPIRIRTLAGGVTVIQPLSAGPIKVMRSKANP